MIKRVKIKNFKCYGDPGADFSLKRINFIFGDNSTGKSSFLQLIRMAFNGESKKIDENFNKYVFKQENDRKIELHVTTTRENEENSPIYSYVKEKNKPSDGPRCVGWIDKDNTSHKNLNELECDPEKNKNLWIPIDAVIHSEAARPQHLKTNASNNTKSSSLAKIDTDNQLSLDGIAYTNRFFKELNLPYAAIDNLTLQDDDFSISIPRKSVGAGIDGLYEIALKLWKWTTKAKESSRCVLLELEEPESHVNELQISPLMDFIFQEAANIPNGQLVIECHSELMALKLKNFLRSKQFTPEDIAVLYAIKTKDGTRIEEISIDEYGVFETRWPGGFFLERSNIIDKFFN